MRQKTEDILRELIRANIERRDRIISAEKFVHHPAVKIVLQHFAQQSEGFIGELDIVLRAYGGDIGSAAAVSADIDAFDFGNCESDQAILLNWARWEDAFLDIYKNVLSNSAELDNTVFEKIRAQRSELDECRQKIDAFK